ncbi:terpene synthase family protein [Streptomyces sp. RP5T]|uniref:terpene synthase family protein n=1 Tax=Streptomyces sp. RP5T TaxID=2490848 RepID=UPI000F647EE0|nr:terpene synthase family protein [Streptomyces sp. RP5T]RRR76200.1 hypothetical protein EHS43_31250 [Streptomyces sp. RP5T]
MTAKPPQASAALDLPALYSPDPPYLNPEANQIDLKASQWMRSRMISQDPVTRQRLLESGASRLLSNWSPRGQVERLVVGGKWTYFGFAYDDWCESLTSLDEIIAATCALSRAQEFPDSALLDTPFLPEFLDIMRDLRRFATPTQYKRLTNQQTAYFQALPWEASYRLRHETPDLNTHVAIRLNAAGGMPLLGILEICNGEEIPSEEFDQPALQAVAEMATLLQAWVNDLCSISKDAHDGGGTNNIVVCLRRERHCSLQDAGAEVVSIWNRTMALFVRLCDQLTAEASPQLNLFVDGCRRAVSNIVLWHARNPRYAAPPLSVTTDPPADLGSSPLNIPSIAWWWQQLK